MLGPATTYAPRRYEAAARAVIHRDAVDAAMRKAAILERLDPRGDPYGAACQALEDFVRREQQIVARGEDVTGWISVVTERRWINELRYQRRRGFDSIDAPLMPGSTTTLGEATASRGLLLEDVVELRECIRGIVEEQRAALAHLRAMYIQDRHVRIVELALATDLLHHEIAEQVNVEFAGSGAKPIAGNSVTQIIRRQRMLLDDCGRFPCAVRRLRRAQRPT